MGILIFGIFFGGVLVVDIVIEWIKFNEYMGKVIIFKFFDLLMLGNENLCDLKYDFV